MARAMRGRTTRTLRVEAPGASVGRWRTPCDAIVCATEAIWSGVASVRYWPIAVAPTSSGVSISGAGGRVLGTSPGTVGSAFQPKRSAAATRSGAPTLTPSGANTELHEWAKLLRNVPPQYSPLAFSSSTPSIVAALAIGNSVVGFTARASRAAAVVTILKVDPGG